ncbi:MAG: epoxyqueuosine reductase QueH [Candidatus Komeilibacteria bacterium]
MKKAKLLLHACCAPCSIYVVQKLAQDYNLTIYYYNPNIHPAGEYQKRLQEIIQWSKKEGIALQEADYRPQDWIQTMQGHEWDKEGGERCAMCYDYRLRQTAEFASVHNFPIFSTTLTISPHKKASVINPIGQKLAEEYGIDFLAADWKKQDGFKIACQLSREAGFYRQDYCGCIYSYRDRLLKDKAKYEAAGV